MTLRQKILDDLKIAMKSGDVLKRDVLRMLDSAIKNMEIEEKKKDQGLSDTEVQKVVARSIKQREDAVKQFELGGRPELAEKEKKEAEILSAYRLQQMSEDEIKEEVKKTITELKLSNKSEVGQLMGKIMKQFQGKVDGQMVKKIAEELLK